jgi:hypothetical protein
MKTAHTVIQLRYEDVAPIFEALTHLQDQNLLPALAKAACKCEHCRPTEVLQRIALNVLALSDQIEAAA